MSFTPPPLVTNRKSEGVVRVLGYFLLFLLSFLAPAIIKKYALTHHISWLRSLLLVSPF